VGDQYNILLSVFFVPYVLTAPILGIIGKKYGPSRVLPIMMFCFGSMTLLTVTVHNFGGLMALRWFLGMSESAFFPLVIYYQTMSVASATVLQRLDMALDRYLPADTVDPRFYRRGELARRLAIFYAASNIAYGKCNLAAS